MNQGAGKGGVGTRGGVGRMRGPGACPVCLLDPQGGQAPGPRPSTTQPLVPTTNPTVGLFHTLVDVNWAGLAPAQFYVLLGGYQVQDDLLIIRGSVGAAAGVGMALVGPTGEVQSGVFVVVSASPQGNERLVLDEDLLDSLDSLLLHSGIGGRGILVQVLVGCGVVPADEVEFARADLVAVQVLIVQVVRSGAANHTTEHHLVVKLAISAQGVVVVLTNGDVFDLDAYTFRLGGD